MKSDYSTKYGIPNTQPLTSRQATARRREVAQEILPWEQAAPKRAATQAKAKQATNTRQASRKRSAPP